MTWMKKNLHKLGYLFYCFFTRESLQVALTPQRCRRVFLFNSTLTLVLSAPPAASPGSPAGCRCRLVTAGHSGACVSVVVLLYSHLPWCGGWLGDDVREGRFHPHFQHFNAGEKNDINTSAVLWLLLSLSACKTCSNYYYYFILFLLLLSCTLHTC